jgi:hypothetical protein
METTQKIYRRAQNEFMRWLEERGYTLPVDETLIARYLQHKLRRAPTCVPLHLSAISRMYKESKWPAIDMQQSAIYKVVQKSKFR